jgi:hypothetical protein
MHSDRVDQDVSSALSPTTVAFAVPLGQCTGLYPSTDHKVALRRVTSGSVCGRRRSPRVRRVTRMRAAVNRSSSKALVSTSAVYH